jgi:hypothetical protein
MNDKMILRSQYGAMKGQKDGMVDAIENRVVESEGGWEE